ncbi:MAG: hypothetical protein ACJ8DC_03515 [Gemmatimonadales bacterium]
MVASSRLPRDGATLRRAALAYPEAVFLAADAGTFSLSAKLPSSAGVALRLPFASPTEYGLGRSGWVTARFPRGARLPLELLKLWIDESYRALAPKRIVAKLGTASRR